MGLLSGRNTSRPAPREAAKPAGAPGGLAGVLQQQPVAERPAVAAGPACNAADLVVEVRQRLIERLNAEGATGLLNRKEDRQAQELLRAYIGQALDLVLQAKGDPGIIARKGALLDKVANDVLGYGVLQPLMDDPDVSNIDCNAHDEIWVTRRGQTVLSDVRFASPADYEVVVRRLVEATGKKIDALNALADGALPDRTRIFAALPPLAVRRAEPYLCVRKHLRGLTREEVVRSGMISEETLQFVGGCVRIGKNVLVTGPMGSGKSTTLNVISEFIPDDERIVTIEDAAELQMRQPNWAPLEARPETLQGTGAVSIRDLCKAALRMDADWVAVGEVRGAEALDMVNAGSSGHRFFSTMHAGSPRQALDRLEFLMLLSGIDVPPRAARGLVASAIHLIVHVEKVRRQEGGRTVKVPRVMRVTEVRGLGQGDFRDQIMLQDLFRYEPDADRLQPTGKTPRFLEDLWDAGVALAPPFAKEEAGAR